MKLVFCVKQIVEKYKKKKKNLCIAVINLENPYDKIRERFWCGGRIYYLYKGLKTCVKSICGTTKHFHQSTGYEPLYVLGTRKNLESKNLGGLYLEYKILKSVKIWTVQKQNWITQYISVLRSMCRQIIFTYACLKTIKKKHSMVNIWKLFNYYN